MRQYPLRPIRSDADLDLAIATLAAVAACEGSFSEEVRNYYDTLALLIRHYEAENVPMPAVSGADMLRHLLEARGAKLSDVAKSTGIALSTLSSVVNGKRRLNVNHFKPLASYFGVEPAVFIE
jgi:HTH-type transcriptional regulator/antitoxin HigA